MSNGAVFDPDKHTLVVDVESVSDVKMIPNGFGGIMVAVDNLTEGIEILHESDRLWWPV